MTSSMAVFTAVNSIPAFLIGLLCLTYIQQVTCPPPPDDPMVAQKENVHPEEKLEDTMTVNNKSSLIFDEQPHKLNTSFSGSATARIAKFNSIQTTLQIIDMASRSWDGRLIIQRIIVNPARPDLYISQAFLRVPFYYNGTLDTTKLNVDYTMMGGYWAILASPPFLTGSLLNQRNAHGKVVVVGLGAGQLNNFLHYHFPELNIIAIEIDPAFGMIAKKYFGFQEDAKQQLYVMDGLKFLARAVSEGRKYDAIYIDACPNMYHEGDEVLCPGEAFLEPANIWNMKRALSDTGTIVIKMLLLAKDVTDKAMELSKPYRQIFGNCAILPMNHLNNRILVCAGRSVGKLDVERLWNEVATFEAPII